MFSNRISISIISINTIITTDVNDVNNPLL